MNRQKLLFIFFAIIICIPAVNVKLFPKVKLKNLKIKEIPAAYRPSKGNSCLDCHKNLKGRLKRPADEWEKSVHAEEGNNCNICHGGNPEINNKNKSKSDKYNFIGKPDKKIITKFCGRGGCHNEALKQFMEGPHYISVLETNNPNCTSCHGKHYIKRSSLDIIKSESCSGCHSVKYSRQIIESISSIEKGIDEIGDNIEFLKSKRAEVKRISNDFNEARHLFHLLVHRFKKKDIEITKKIVELEINNLKNESDAKVASIKRLDFLYLIMVGFGIMIGLAFVVYIFLMYNKRR